MGAFHGSCDGGPKRVHIDDGWCCWFAVEDEVEEACASWGVGISFVVAHAPAVAGSHIGLEE